MIVLDTNVVSETMRPQPHASVVAWLDRLDPGDAYLTSISAAELRLGVELLPDSARRRQLGEQVDGLLGVEFRGRVLAFDAASPLHYAGIVAGRRRAGRPIGMADAQIAAVCRQHGCGLATRNLSDFDDVGVDVVDPWANPA